MIYILDYKNSHLDKNTLRTKISQISNYDIEDHIGYSEDSYVYKCNKKDKDNKKYILKIIPEIEYTNKDNIIIDEKYIKENNNIEFNIIKNNKNENLLKLLDYFYIIIDFTDNKYGCFCIITDICDHDLSKLDLTKYDYNIKKELCLELCNGLEELHNRGYYHGDLKLFNIGIKYRNNIPHIIILDFGVSNKITNTQNIINTFPFTTPISCFNHLKMNFLNINKNWLDKNVDYLESLILKKYRTKYFYINNKRLFIDERINNEIFILGLLFIYILSDGYHFYSREKYNGKFTLSYLENIIKYSEDNENYLFSFIFDKKDNSISNKLEIKSYPWFILLKKMFDYDIKLVDVIKNIRGI